jgi:predicted metalloprotease with PDZ domain
MIKKIAICLICFCKLSSAFAERKSDTYYFSIDLRSVVDDKLSVTLLTPEIKKEEVIYYLPKIVPGTYSIYNFGRFVSDFKAFDKAGNELIVEKKEENGWIIKQATRLDKLTYSVDDTWDAAVKDDFVFEPGGTNIEADKNFVLNTHGFFGYFEEMKNMPYELNVAKPQGFFGSTGLNTVVYKDTNDIFYTSDYMSLVDAPIMYNLPDTTTIHIGGASILISIYDKSKKVTSRFLADNISSILMAQKEYLGGTLPVKKYAFIVYLSEQGGLSGSYGALEHSYSSFYFLPAMLPENLAQTVKDVAAHEFFHIVTPLSIHSEEIGNFDYNNPKMSRHLWLYEGVTEYFASNVQVKYGLMKPVDYFDVIRGKMLNAEAFKEDVLFTELSLGCLSTYKDQYNNVYEKGALIGLCLDLKLRELSTGKYSLQNLMYDLSKSYGKEKSFKDSLLFDQIVALTYPEIGVFLQNYIAGNKPLPFKTCLGYAGIDYEADHHTTDISVGGVDLAYDKSTGMIMVESITNSDEIGKALDYRQGDVLQRFYGKRINQRNVEKVFGRYYNHAKQGDLLKVTVLRKDEHNKLKKVRLRTRIKPVDIIEKHVIKPAVNPSSQQLEIRKAWLGSWEADK